MLQSRTKQLFMPLSWIDSVACSRYSIEQSARSSTFTIIFFYRMALEANVAFRRLWHVLGGGESSFKVQQLI
jgi:hypothetical protein